MTYEIKGEPKKEWKLEFEGKWENKIWFGWQNLNLSWWYFCSLLIKDECLYLTHKVISFKPLTVRVACKIQSLVKPLKLSFPWKLQEKPKGKDYMILCDLLVV